MKKYDNLTDKCIHCGKCTSVCEFLTKYNLDLDGFNGKKDLAYSCFLCGDCRRVCPVDIDGREISLVMRKDILNKNSGKTAPSFNLLKLEKNSYKFKNYRRAVGKSVLFPGCNFLSFYPETSEKLIDLMKENGIGAMFDCCSKPISEIGLDDDSSSSVDFINRYIAENQIEELIMVCPNCYYFLKNRIDAKCITIYEKLNELGLGKKIEYESIRDKGHGLKENLQTDSQNYIYIPCPDRDSRKLYKDLTAFMDMEKYKLADAQCCGLGGLAKAKEPGISNDMSEKFSEFSGTVYSYCATCAGNINLKTPGKSQHVLTKILGTEEASSKGIATVFNRAKYKFK